MVTAIAYQCDKCRDEGEVINSRTTTKCDCQLKQAWSYLRAHIPDEHRPYAVLSKLTPNAKFSLAPKVQQEMIDEVKANPEDSFILSGKNSWGKTTCSYALYRHAMYEEMMRIWNSDHKIKWFNGAIFGKWGDEFAVCKVTAESLLQQYAEWRTRRDDACEPVVTRRLIEKFKRHGVRFHLFLEEIDKITMSEPKRNTLFEIVNALCEFGGQLVITTNLRKDELADLLGPDFTTRFLRMGTRVIDLYGRTKQ